MAYAVAKALHFIGFISWFAGLFYMPRLFIYHVEAGEKDEAERSVLQKQFELMAARLWKIITTPAMLVTLAAGGTMIALRGGTVPGWLQIKFGFLALLLIYHFVCGNIRKQQASGTCTWTSKKLRVFNEGATMLMVAIVCLAVFKSSMNALWGSLGFVALGIALMFAIRLYARLRKD